MATKFLSIRYPPNLLEEGRRAHLEWLFKETFQVQEVRWTEAPGSRGFAVTDASKEINLDTVRELLWGEGVWDGCDDDY